MWRFAMHRYDAMHMIRKGQVTGWRKAMYSVRVSSFTPCLASQKAVIDLHGLLRYFTVICDRPTRDGNQS